MEINVEQIKQDLERQEKSARERFDFYKSHGDPMAITQALFCVGKLAGKIEQLQMNGIDLAIDHLHGLSVLRGEIQDAIEKKLKGKK